MSTRSRIAIAPPHHILERLPYRWDVWTASVDGHDGLAFGEAVLPFFRPRCDDSLQMTSISPQDVDLVGSEIFTTPPGSICAWVWVIPVRAKL